MSIYTIFLVIHIIAGSICLLTGAVAAFARKRKGNHTLFGEVYHANYAIVFITAVVMSIMNWSELAFLFYVAIFSYGLALIGYLARKRRPKNWLPMHINGMLGSYIGVVTAVLVVNGSAVASTIGIPSWFLWLLPTIIGSPITAITINRFVRKV